MPPKKQKKSPPPKNIKDVPAELRMRVVEFLPPNQHQQAVLTADYKFWREQEKVHQDAIFMNMPADYLKMGEYYTKNAEKWYKQRRDLFMSAPSLHETYDFFWDKDRPWPDQGPDPDHGPIST
jgi:hypothetical protein